MQHLSGTSFFKIGLFILERERQSVVGKGRREGREKFQVDSMLNGEPDMGLKLKTLRS